MAEGGNGKGIPSWVWIVVALVVGYFLLQKAEGAAKKAVGGSANQLGKGIGQGAVTSIGSALGSFASSLFSSKSSSSHATSSSFKPDTSAGLSDNDFNFSAASSDDLIDPSIDDAADE